VTFDIDQTGLLINCQSYEETMNRGKDKQAGMLSGLDHGAGQQKNFEIEGCKLINGITPPSHPSLKAPLAEDKYYLPVSDFDLENELKNSSAIDFTKEMDLKEKEAMARLVSREHNEEFKSPLRES
jgi:hypothetical protein